MVYTQKHKFETLVYFLGFRIEKNGELTLAKRLAPIHNPEYNGDCEIDGKILPPEDDKTIKNQPDNSKPYVYSFVPMSRGDILSLRRKYSLPPENRISEAISELLKEKILVVTQNKSTRTRKRASTRKKYVVSKSITAAKRIFSYFYQMGYPHSLLVNPAVANTYGFAKVLENFRTCVLSMGEFELLPNVKEQDEERVIFEKSANGNFGPDVYFEGLATFALDYSGFFEQYLQDEKRLRDYISKLTSTFSDMYSLSTILGILSISKLLTENRDNTHRINRIKVDICLDTTQIIQNLMLQKKKAQSPKEVSTPKKTKASTAISVSQGVLPPECTPNWCYYGDSEYKPTGVIHSQEEQ